jgi:prephenate dehydrogenase
MKFSRITKTDCKTHDEKIGFTSQLCHVVASAMVESAEDSSITSFGGGSFEDLTRIAMINAPLWTELFLSNKVALLKHIKSFISKMQEFETLIQNEDEQQLEDLLKDVRKKRIEMNELR